MSLDDAELAAVLFPEKDRHYAKPNFEGMFAAMRRVDFPAPAITFSIIFENAFQPFENSVWLARDFLPAYLTISSV